MIQLHYAPSTASMAPHILLQELGLPFELVEIDKAGGGLDTPAYRKLNPNGLIPVLVEGDLVLYETAAICLYLADSHIEAGLIPALGSKERAHCYKWLSWLSTTLQTALIVYFYPERWTDDASTTAQVKANAERRVLALLDQLEAELAHGKAWLLGEAYSVVDIYAMMLCRWTRHFSSPASSRPVLQAYLQRVLARPAVQAVFAREGLAQPWV